MNAIRLYLDADVSAELAIQLRAQGIDAICARDEGQTKLSDAEQLALAVRHHRAVFTHNRDHFEELVVEYFEQAKEHFGVIIAPQYELGELLRRVVKLAESESAESLQNQIRYLHAYR
ncbi:MAG: DUF5615 family PIN-like protein [Chloroflexi bacterium]|nr:DUF5615 family PIN-like protein [Chloroflexota bacterium]